MADNNHQIKHGEAISSIIEVLEPLEESGRRKVLDAVLAYFGSPVPKKPDQEREVALLGNQPSGAVLQKDIRSFKDEKKPKTAIEMAAVMAYFLKEMAPSDEKKDVVAEQDVEKYFNQADFHLPKNFRATLDNAKNAGYFELVEKGKFKLNSVGHNLVAHHLPKENKTTKPRLKRKDVSPVAKRKKSHK